MATIKQDYLADTAVASETYDGVEVNRVILVQGFSTTGLARLQEALAASGIPAIGAACPVTEWAALKVVSRRAEMVDALTARVYIDYRETLEGATVMAIQSTLTSVKTNKDRTGALMVVTHNGIDQAVELDVQRPVVSITYERDEATLPLEDALELVGTVNNSTFEGLDAGTVLLTGMSATPNDRGNKFRVRYEVTHNVDGWASLAYWIDPNTGRPPATLVDGVGTKTFTQFDSANLTGIITP